MSEMPSYIPSETEMQWEINDERYIYNTHRIIKDSDLETNSQK